MSIRITPSNGASALTLIAEETLAADAASVDFTSIPQTYTNLVVRFSARTARSASPVSMFMSANNDTTDANYAAQGLRGNGTSPLAFEAIGTAAARRMAYLPGSTATAGLFNTGSVLVPNYTGGNTKAWHCGTFMASAFSSGDLYMTNFGTVWDSTDAITRLTFAADGGDLVAGSTFQLLGES